ncbi:MAG: restriction endonuclease subunit S [Paraclostridium sp.]
MNKTPKLRFNEFSEGWESKKIGQTLKIKHGKDQKKVQVENGVYPILATGGEIGRTNTPLYDKESVLIGRKGTINRPFYMNTPFWTVDTLFYSEIKEGMHPKFIYYKFQNINWKKYCEASGVPSLSASTIEGIKYNIPSIVEQEKIASFFSLIDNKISLQSKKVNFLKEYNNGIMQRIFSNELRFKDDEGRDYTEWEEKKLGDYIIEYKEKTTENNQYPPLTSSRKGLFLQSDYFDKQIASTDNTGYNIVPRNYFTYRHMSDDAMFFFNINNLVDNGIVSTLYPVFTTNDKLDSIFLRYYLNETNEFKQYSLLQKQGGSRTYMYLSKLKEFKIKIPNIYEQNKIVKLLVNLESKLEKEQEKLASLNEYKNGLLQQMFV